MALFLDIQLRLKTCDIMIAYESMVMMLMMMNQLRSLASSLTLNLYLPWLRTIFESGPV